MNIAINGFGRIGKAALKIAINKGYNVLAINDLADPLYLANSLKYDTVYGVYPKNIVLKKDNEIIYSDEHYLSDNLDSKKESLYTLNIEGNIIKVLREKDPLNLPWNNLKIDVVLDCTGVFNTTEKANLHKIAGAKNVIISAPAKDEITKTFVHNINNDSFSNESIISNASCTTNCISPIIRVLENELGIEKSFLTTIHSVTASQNLVDGFHKDLRRSRSGFQNIIPTTTGAAKLTSKIIPEISNFDGLAIRVPVISGSLIDLTALVKKKTDIETLNSIFIDYSKKPLFKDILSYTYKPLVSSDILGSSYSSIVDLSMTKVIEGDFIKILAWYDNEWGYASRLVDMLSIYK